MDATPRPQFTVTTETLGPQPQRAPSLVVAVPVKNEVERIGLCLEALASQDEVAPGDMAVVLMLNNTDDGTAQQVRELAPLAPYAIHLCQVELDAPHANAGWARRLAMDHAADLAAPGGLLLTTDADTLVNGDWVATNRREIERGVDAVAGYVMADPMELMQLDAAVLDRGRLEWQYQQLAAELVARVDREAHDPWPRHNQNCGASAAITVDAYRRIGGLPPKPVGEDRALFEKVRELDGRVRHSLDVQVVTSARTDGRACGGLADEIRLRTDPDHPCDDALEVAMATLRRAQWRCEFRYAWTGGRVDAAAWGRRLHLSELEVRQATVPQPLRRGLGRAGGPEPPPAAPPRHQQRPQKRAAPHAPHGRRGPRPRTGVRLSAQVAAGSPCDGARSRSTM